MTDYLRNDFELSNPITFAGLKFSNVENAFQAAKVAPDERKPMQICTVEEARKIGRSVVLPADWDKNRYDIMLALVRQKFQNNADLAEQLVNTGLEDIAIVNNNDLFWGCTTKDGVFNGQNNLGKILMIVRKELQILSGWSKTDYRDKTLQEALANYKELSDQDFDLLIKNIKMAMDTFESEKTTFAKPNFVDPGFHRILPPGIQFNPNGGWRA